MRPPIPSPARPSSAGRDLSKLILAYGEVVSESADRRGNVVSLRFLQIGDIRMHVLRRSRGETMQSARDTWPRSPLPESAAARERDRMARDEVSDERENRIRILRAPIR